MINKLLERLPKKYHNRVAGIESCYDLVDNCKYMLYFADGYAWCGDYTSLPCRSISEAIKFIKEACYHE